MAGIERLLEDLSLSAIARGQSLKRRHFRTGESLIRQGDSASGVFILVDGLLDVIRQVDGESVHLATIDQPGALIGEIVALAGGTRTASVVATAPSEVVELTAEEMAQVVATRPDLGQKLSSLALQRAEETEFVELLASHLGIRDRDTLEQVRASAEWRYLSAGEVLFEQGDPSETIFLVLRGRLRVERREPGEKDEAVGTVGRGEVVGELGMLQGVARMATVTALRDSVVAVIGADAFYLTIERHPRVMSELGMRALARAATPASEAPPRVLALLVSPNLNHSYVTGLVVGELQEWGSVAVFSSQLVDAALDAPEASEALPGEVGDVSLSRLLNEAESENDYVVLVLTRSPGAWSRRCLSLADRLVIVLPADPPDDDVDHVIRLLGKTPRYVPPVVVLAHQPEVETPRGSAEVAERIGAVDVFHVQQGSSLASDVSRVARVIAGRGHALVLGGGGGRGFAHIGVLRALKELGTPVDIVGGASIGGILSFVIADEMEGDRLIEWASRHFGRSLDYTLPLVSLIKAGRITESARETFGGRYIEDLWWTSFAVSADLTTSRVHVHRRGPIDIAVRATSAIPGVMPPVPHGDSLLVDGGVLNNLPIDVARQMSPEGVVFASDVVPSDGPRASRDYGLSVSGWGALLSNLRSERSGHPGISSVMLRSMTIGSMRQRDIHLSADLADCYMNLDMRGVGMLDFDGVREVAQRGYETAMPMLEQWLENRQAGLA